MFGLISTNLTVTITKKISQRRAECVDAQRAGDHQRYAEMMAEIAALEEHMLAMRESGLA